MADDAAREPVGEEMEAAVGPVDAAGGGNGAQPGAAANGQPVDSHAAVSAADQTQTSPKRTRAIVYVPHLGHTPGRSINDFATRLATVLNQKDQQRPPTYVVEDAAETVRFGASQTKSVAPGVTIVRNEGPAATALGIYEFSYSDEFSRRFDEKSSLMKALSLLMAVGLNLGRLAGSFVRGRAPGEGRSIAVGILLSVALVLGSVVHLILGPWGRPAFAVAAVGAAGSAWLAFAERDRQRQHSTEEERVPNVAGAVWFGLIVALAGAMLTADFWSSWDAKLVGQIAMVVGLLWLLGAWLTLSSPDVGHRVQIAIGFGGLGLMTLYAILLVAAGVSQGAALIENGDTTTLDKVADVLAGAAITLTAIGVVVTPAELAKRLNNASAQLLATIEYLSHGRGRDAQTGRLYALIEHLAEAGYTAVDVVAYSFGSIISLDALYRLHPAQVPEGTAEVVERVVTIGSPVVTIATFWPTYWESRSRWNGTWINLYSPIDVLSSNVCGHANPDGKPGSMVPTDADGKQLLPEQPERVFPTTTGKLSVFEKLAVRGLKAHADYWETPFNEDQGAVGMIGDLWSGPDWGPPPPQPSPLGVAEEAGMPVPAGG